ncbi:hypothetical protein [uncultured Polaribacter sp.]|uniref:hypothetical protein n=1 Tax=uncultured Polaribacter sp. TaxID=174711 RepID=UPI00262E7152|nr:hypothetical protein [uncultured Polaribacter sp.]
MRKLNPLLFLLILFSCSVTNYQKKGTVNPKNFNYETAFTTLKTVIIFPAEIEGKSKNFYFDTGAQYSIIQRDTLIGSLVNVSGASKRSIEAGSEIVKMFKIGDIEFTNTVAINTDMVGLKEKISNFGGLIGQPIIEKANWLIDYPNKKLKISSKNLADDSFQTIKIKRKGGSPYTYISINGIEYKVVIDFGSSSEFSLPKESKLAKQLLQQYTFEANERERYTIGGRQIIKEKVGILPMIKIGDIEFKNIQTKINEQSQPRIGIGFFKDYTIYIDNIENNYKIKKSAEQTD